MTPSIRKSIRLALVVRLQSIRTTAGYATDAGLNVSHAEPLTPSEHDADPRIGLLDGEMPEGERQLGGKEQRRWPFRALGAVAVDPTRPLDLPEEDLLADLKSALFGGDRTLGGLVEGIFALPGETTTGRDQAGLRTATCVLPFEVVYHERPGRPLEDPS